MDIFSPTLQYLADKSKRMTSKAALIISVIIILILADNIFGYTYYSNNSKKIEQVKEINLLLKDTSLPESLKQSFIKLRQQVTYHKSIKDYLSDFFTNISFTNSKSNLTTNPINAYPLRNDFLHFLSSAWLTIVAMLFIVVIFFKNLLFHKTRTPFYKDILLLFVMEAILYTIAILQSKIFSLIPIIDNNPKINYTINALLDFVIIFIPYLILARFLKKRAKKIEDEVNKANG